MSLLVYRRNENERENGEHVNGLGSCKEEVKRWKEDTREKCKENKANLPKEVQKQCRKSVSLQISDEGLQRL